MPSSSQSQVQITSDSRTIILFESLESGVNSFSNFLKSLYDSKRFGINGAILGEENLLHNGLFSAIESLLPYFPNIHKYSQNETHLLLGSTNDFIFLDLTQNFNPNKLIIAIETVIAGGVIVLLGKKYETWLKTVNKHRFPFSQKSNLLSHFLKGFERNSGCINANDKEFDITPYFKPVSLKNILSEEFLGIPISNDQMALIKSLSWGCNMARLLFAPADKPKLRMNRSLTNNFSPKTSDNLPEPNLRITSICHILSLAWR